LEDTRVHVEPASSERQIVPARLCTTAYTRAGSLGAMPMPMRPSGEAGNPWPVTCRHVAPPSVDL
jgi:hypothetical protein